ncbi:MAG: hypothetical protein ACXAEN_23195 [Candidatus Thorarchaeota archaeon]|jgi:hypothetical protein
MNATIQRNHPVRHAVASLATTGHGTYYTTRANGLKAIKSELMAYGMEMDYAGFIDPDRDEGRYTFPIIPHGECGIVCDDCDKIHEIVEYNHVVVFTWCRMVSGLFEVNCYIS